MTVAYISHPSCLLHRMSLGHPECPERLQAIEDHLRQAQLLPRLLHIEARPVDTLWLKRVHTEEYVDAVLTVNPRDNSLVWLDPDTAMNKHSLNAALHAAGAVVNAVDLVMQEKVRAAFCNIRPPGHHAEPNRAMGFCIFNNIAVGAQYALQRHQLERVAIVDFDVHHGNGTEAIFHDREDVLFCSTFQHPFYPYCGTERVVPNCVNVPIPAHTDGGGFRQAVNRFWLPRLNAFAPQLILVSAGFDAHVDDPLASLKLTEDDYTWVTEQIMDVARRHARGRIVSSLEGGYNLDALGRSAVAHVRALMGHGPDDIEKKIF